MQATFIWLIKFPPSAPDFSSIFSLLYVSLITIILFLTRAGLTEFFFSSAKKFQTIKCITQLFIYPRSYGEINVLFINRNVRSVDVSEKVGKRDFRRDHRTRLSPIRDRKRSREMQLVFLSTAANSVMRYRYL